MARNDVEGPIHQAIFETLRYALLDGSMIHHSPNEIGARLPEEVKRIIIGKWKAKGMRPGWPDLEIIARQRDGSWRLLMIEVKSPTGRQQPNQKEVQAEFEALGIPYAICRSAYDVDDILKRENIDTRLAA